MSIWYQCTCIVYKILKKVYVIIELRRDTYLVSILSSFTKAVAFTGGRKENARLRCAYVWPGSARRAKFRAVTLRRDDNVAWWGSYSPRPRWNNALSSNTVYYRVSRGVERMQDRERCMRYIERMRERERDARGFEHFEGLSHAWRTHIVRFLHKVGRRDAAVFRSNWIYWESSEYRVDRNGANPRTTTKYSVAVIPLRYSFSPREPHPRIFSPCAKMQIAAPLRSKILHNFVSTRTN